MAVLMVMSMLPLAMFAEDGEGVPSKITVKYISGGEEKTELFDSFEAALGVNEDPETAVTVTINEQLDGVNGFDVGTSDSVTRKIVLDLNGTVLTVASPVAENCGIRVLFGSELTVTNGTVKFSAEVVTDPETAVETAVKSGFMNHGKLVMDNLTVDLQENGVITETVANRGELVLSGTTALANASSEINAGFVAAVTLAPISDANASLKADGAVTVGNLLLKRTGADVNEGKIVLDITAGTFGTVTEDGGDKVGVIGNISGGTFANDVIAYCAPAMKVVKAEDTVNYSVVACDASDFRFEKPEVLINGWNPVVMDGKAFVNYTQTVNNFTQEQVEYSIAEGGENGKAEINAETGELTVYVPCRVKVCAKVGGYSASYYIDFTGVEVIPSFKDPAVEFISGVPFEVQQIDTSVWYKGLSIEFPVSEDKNSIFTKNASGSLVFTGNTGSAVVSATVKDANEYANRDVPAEKRDEYIAKYTVEVTPWKVPANAYSIVGTKGNGDWYKSEVSLKAAEGYALSFNKVVWGETLAKQSSDSQVSYSFYVKDKTNGYVSELIVLEDLLVDTAAPSATIKIPKVADHFSAINAWGDSLSYISEKPEDVKPEVTYIDANKVSIEYLVDYIGDGNDIENKEALNKATGWVDSVKLNATNLKKVVIYAKLTDEAGNVTYVSTNGIVCDGIAPVISDGFEGDEARDANIYTESFKVNLTVTDQAPYYPDLTDIRYQINDGEWVVVDPATVDPSKREELSIEYNLASIEIPLVNDSEEDVTLKVAVTDKAGNKAEQTFTYKVDTKTPEIEVVYGLNSKDNAENGFYTDGIVTVTVTDKYFDAENTVITFTQVKANGDLPEKSTVTFADEWKDNGENAHSMVITLAGDANYTLTVDTTDKAGHAAETYVSEDQNGDHAGHFTVDATAPTGKVTEDTNEWTELVNKLTFGIWKNTATTVKVSCEDAVSPTDIKVYKSSKTEIEDLNTVKWEDYDAEKGVPVDNDELVTVYVRLCDAAGNVSYISSNGIIVEDNAPVFNSANGNVFTLSGPVNEATGIYTGDVNVSFSVADIVEENDVYSGIKKITYTVVCDGEEVQPETFCDEFTAEDPVYDELGVSGDVNVVVAPKDKDGNPVSGVIEFIVNIEDNAGNTSSASTSFEIDVLDPVIKVVYDRSNKNSDAQPGFYTSASAVVTVTERNFDPDNSVIKVTGVDANGETVENSYEVQPLTLVDGTSLNETQYKAVIDFYGDANYTVSVEAKDKVDHKSTFNSADENGAHVGHFTVDNVIPTANAKVEVKSESKLNTATSVFYPGFKWGTDGVLSLNVDKWIPDSLVWIPTDMIVGAISNDSVSPVHSFRYRVDKNGNEGQWTDVDVSVKDNEGYSAIGAEGDFTGLKYTDYFVVYFEVKDSAGNVYKFNTYTNQVETADPDFAKIGINLPATNGNGFYNGNFDVTVTAEETGVETGGGTVYAGLAEVRIDVVKDGASTRTETYHKFVDDITFAKTITVDAWANNSNDVSIVVTVTDKAGNTTQKTLSGIKVDVTAPTIAVTYDNNSADATYGDHFKADRTATVTITERNFDPNDVIVNITNTDGYVPVISGFTSAGSGDDTVHVATIRYTRDGDYTFEIAYTDEADNKATDITYGGTAPQKFTIDKTKPVVNVSFDNNAVENGNYYKDTRTATIQVTEHNFDASRFVLTGEKASLRWSHSGNVHTATMSFTADKLYEFDFTYKDKAGNEAADYSKDTFYIDKTAPILEVFNNATNEALPEKSAYNGDIDFRIEYEDQNVDSKRVEIKMTSTDGKDFTAVIEDAGREGYRVIKSVKDLVHSRQIEDGIYTITITAYDLAGNTASLERTVSVNRDSSNYLLSEALAKLVDDKYVTSISEDVVISEVNCTEIESQVLTVIRDGISTVLSEDQYTVERTNDANSWFEYKYSIDPSVFAKDGNYTVMIESVDAAGNSISNLSAIEAHKKDIQFSVDSTAPVLIVSGLDEDRYKAESIEAFFTFEDNLGVERIVITVERPGEDAKDIEYVLENREDLNALSDRVTETLRSADRAQTVTVKVVDLAGNESEIYTKSVTVSSSWWVIFLSNTPLVIITLAAIVLIVAAVIIIPVVLKKKKTAKK
ncbi:MAG: Ig-like domain repeat protein [Clostridia bacterium]|nr:Ig-like domain repeat protein [Clostridia bacterium]